MTENHSYKDNNELHVAKNRFGQRMTMRYWSVVIILLVLLLVALVLWLDSLRVQPVIECVTVNEDLARTIKKVPDDGPFLIDDQVIVTGPSSQVEEVLASIDLELVRKCKLNYLSETSDKRGRTSQYFPFSDNRRGRFE